MIWLIGGTSESRAVAAALDQAGLPWVVTVVSDRARQLYPGRSGRVVVGQLTDVAAFLQTYDICGIVDASHPFATEISQTAIATGLPYIRLERPSPLPTNAIVLHRLADVLQDGYLAQRRVLLTVGVKWLSHFVPWLTKGEFWARILPTAASRKLAIASGFPESHLIPMQLPVTVNQETELWRSHSIDTVITKASGDAGGMAVKATVAAELGVRLIAIDRPAIAYPQYTEKVDDVLAFCSPLMND
jgi:precorrin-6A/cobalt-precorrin-6A reductase